MSGAASIARTRDALAAAMMETAAAPSAAVDELAEKIAALMKEHWPKIKESITGAIAEFNSQAAAIWKNFVSRLKSGTSLSEATLVEGRITDYVLKPIAEKFGWLFKVFESLGKSILDLIAVAQASGGLSVLFGAVGAMLGLGTGLLSLGLTICGGILKTLIGMYGTIFSPVVAVIVAIAMMAIVIPAHVKSRLQ